MISAQNHHPLSSGNSILFTLFAIILFAASCSSSKAVMQKQKPKNKVVIEKPKDQVLPQKVDTVEWTEISEVEAPPIINETPAAPGLDKKSQYNISLLMPLDANKLNSASDDAILNDNKFINFYAGAMLAFEALERDGIDLNVNVYDSKTENLDNLMSGYELRNSDIIIGPRDTDELKKVATFGKEREISVISPWKSSSQIASENPYYIQLIPGLYDHYYRIAEHAAENFDNQQVVLLGRNSTDKRRFKYFQQDDEQFQEFMVNEDSLMVGETAFDSLMIDVSETTAFIIPNYSSKDERFIYNCLRRLNIEKGMKNVVVYGMPIMKDSDRTTYNFYTSLNMHICLSKFVDVDDRDVINFERAYYEKYAALPTSDAYEGYDVMTYIGKSLDRYGKNFQFHLEEDDDNYLQTSYQLDKVFKSLDMDKENFENINYYGNKYLDIIAFKQKSFKRLEE